MGGSRASLDHEYPSIRHSHHTEVTELDLGGQWPPAVSLGRCHLWLPSFSMGGCVGVSAEVFSSPEQPSTEALGPAEKHLPPRSRGHIFLSLGCLETKAPVRPLKTRHNAHGRPDGKGSLLGS